MNTSKGPKATTQERSEPQESTSLRALARLRFFLDFFGVCGLS